MADVVCINGSPRIDGNTDNYLKIFCKVLRNEGVDVQVINLREKNINMCIACGKCEADYEHACVWHDDMTEIIDSLLKAKAILLATPTYYANVSTLLKNFMDRTDCLFHKKRLKDKFGMGLTVGGFQNGGQEMALQSINAYFMIHNMIVVGGNGGSSYLGISGKAYAKKEYQKDKSGKKNCVKSALRLAQIIDKGKVWYQYDTKQEAVLKTVEEMQIMYPENDFENIRWDYEVSLEKNFENIVGLLKDKQRSDLFFKIFNKKVIDESNKKYGSISYMKMYQKERNHAVGDWSRYFLDILKGIKGNILVVGINDGQEMEEVIKNKDIKCYGLDICERAINRGKFLYPNIEFQIGRSDKLPYDANYFDCYISLRTLQVTGIDFQASIEEAKRALKLEGKIIISLPNGTMKSDGEISSGQYIENQHYGYKTQFEKMYHTISGMFSNVNVIENPIETFIVASNEHTEH